MTNQPPDFDPFELLGVDATADSATIDRAYKARIRYVHPDIAGNAGLDESKRLNIAREWLLDPELRAQLPKPRPTRDRARARPGPETPRPPAWSWDGSTRARPPWDYDARTDDPLTFEYGPRTDEVRAFFGAIRALTSDERARVTYSLGDEPPVFFDSFKDRVSAPVWARSRALEDAVEHVWRERYDEDRPLLFPRGRVFGNGIIVANAYAQWILLREAIRQQAHGDDAETLARRSTVPWQASVGHSRYGDAQDVVVAFLDDARVMPLASAERLARSWQRHMGSYLYGRPGEDWFPGALDHADPQLVSARLAAVDASRIEPPSDLEIEHHGAFRYGLRLTAHVLGLGGGGERIMAGRDYLKPWRDALDASPSFHDRARWAMPLG